MIELAKRPAAFLNYKASLVNRIDRGVKKYEHRYATPAVGLCNHCNREVTLSNFTNTCECGADYNMSGQELAPRSQWGEETGESLDDILSIQ